MYTDISLENILISNGEFMIQDDGYYKISRKLRIKLVDFGLAECFNKKQRFLCTKYCGKVTYEAPEVLFNCLND